MLNTEPYWRALENADESIRCEALSALLSKGMPVAVELFIQSAQDSSAKVREMAVSGLGRFGNPVAIPALMDALNDTEGRVRAEAAYALCQFREEKTVSGILNVLERATGLDKVVVIMGLLQFPHAEFAPVLQSALASPESDLQNAAQAVLDRHQDFYHLRRMQPSEPQSKSGRQWVAYEKTIQEILDLDPDMGVDSILRMLASEPHAAERVRMVRALACQSDPSSLIPLVQCGEDPDPEVRRAAIDELGHLDDPIAQEMVERALGNSAEQVRVEALFAYARKKPSGLVIRLERMMQIESSERVRETILYKLAKHDFVKARPYLRDDLSSENKEQRLRAAVLLAEHRDVKAKEVLWKALDDPDEWARALAIYGVGKLGDQSLLDRLVEALQDSDPDVRLAAAESLGNLGDSRALEPLRTALYDVYPAVRETVSESLSRLEHHLHAKAG